MTKNWKRIFYKTGKKYVNKNSENEKCIDKMYKCGDTNEKEERSRYK